MIGLSSWVSCKSGQEPNPEEGACQHLQDLGVVMLGMRLLWWEGWRPKFLECKHIEPTCLSVNGALDHRPGFPLLPSHSPSRGLTRPCQKTAVLGHSQLLAARCAPHRCPAQPAWLRRPQISSPNTNRVPSLKSDFFHLVILLFLSWWVSPTKKWSSRKIKYNPVLSCMMLHVRILPSKSYRQNETWLKTPTQLSDLLQI